MSARLIKLEIDEPENSKLVDAVERVTRNIPSFNFMNHPPKVLVSSTVVEEYEGQWAKIDGFCTEKRQNKDFLCVTVVLPAGTLGIQTGRYADPHYGITSAVSDAVSLRLHIPIGYFENGKSLSVLSTVNGMNKAVKNGSFDLHSLFIYEEEN